MRLFIASAEQDGLESRDIGYVYNDESIRQIPISFWASVILNVIKRLIVDRYIK